MKKKKFEMIIKQLDKKLKKIQRRCKKEIRETAKNSQ